MDEIYSYHKEMIGILEQKGEIKKGTYERLSKVSEVDKLRNQLLKING